MAQAFVDIDKTLTTSYLNLSEGSRIRFAGGLWQKGIETGGESI